MHTPSGWRFIYFQFGLPSVVVTDNGSYFSSVEFGQFLKSNGIQQRLVERGVQIFKREMQQIGKRNKSNMVPFRIFFHTFSFITISPLEQPLDCHQPSCCRIDGYAVSWIWLEQIFILEYLKISQSNNCNHSNTPQFTEGDLFM